MPSHDSSSSALQDFNEKPRRKLIEAAAEVFSAVGYDAATVREICARAGMNVASVNYHFGDKLGLFKATLRFAVASEGTPGPVSGLKSLPPEEALRKFIKTFKHFAQTDHPAFYTRLMMRELAAPTSGLSLVVEHLVRPRHMILVEIVGRILGLPSTHKKTRLAAHSIISQALHYSQGRTLIGLLWPDWTIDPGEMEEILDYVADFSLAALRALKEGEEMANAEKMLSKKGRHSKVAAAGAGSPAV